MLAYWLFFYAQRQSSAGRQNPRRFWLSGWSDLLGAFAFDWTSFLPLPHKYTIHKIDYFGFSAQWLQKIKMPEIKVGTSNIALPQLKYHLSSLFVLSICDALSVCTLLAIHFPCIWFLLALHHQAATLSKEYFSLFIFEADKRPSRLRFPANPLNWI